MRHTEVYLKDDPQWYKDAIIYELHIRAFYDSNADGIGDIQGALEKLDYLGRSRGYRSVAPSLLPIAPEG